MAIKVNGTTVINDSRSLTNIASVDATTKNAIEAAGVGGAVDLSGGVGSSGVYLTATSIPPIGCAIIVHANDSYVNDNNIKDNYYGRQFTAATGQPANRLFIYTGNTNQNGTEYKNIVTGTWRALVATGGGGAGSIICQRIA